MYSVEMDVKEIFMVDADSAEEAEDQAVSLVAQQYDISPLDINIINVKEVK